MLPFRFAYRFMIVFMLSVAFASAGGAQNRGEDPAKFELTHFSAHGQWEIFCGHFGSPKSERCDLRRTDILSPRPNFRAMVIYVRYHRDGPVISLDAERSTHWVGGGVKLNDQLAFPLDGCLFGRCALRGADAARFVTRLGTATSVALSFIDVKTRRQVDWDLADLRKALAELAALRTKKGLP